MVSNHFSTGVGIKGGAVTLRGVYVDSTVVHLGSIRLLIIAMYSSILSWISSASKISVSISSGDFIASSTCVSSCFSVSFFWVNYSIMLVNFAI